MYYITASFYGLGAEETTPYIYGNADPARWRTYTSRSQRHEVTIESDYDTVCANVVCAATLAQHEWGRSSRGRLRPHRPAPRVLCQSGTTNHDSTDRMSEQYLFYRKNETIYCAKYSVDEPPCWNVSGWQRQNDEGVYGNSVRIFGQYDVKIASGSCIDNVTITQLFLFEIVSGTTRNVQYDFRLLRVTWRFKIQMDSGVFHWWISPEIEVTSMIPCFSSFMTESFGTWRYDLVVTSVTHEVNNVFNPLKYCQTSYL